MIIIFPAPSPCNNFCKRPVQLPSISWIWKYFKRSGRQFQPGISLFKCDMPGCFYSKILNMEARQFYLWDKKIQVIDKFIYLWYKFTYIKAIITPLAKGIFRILFSLNIEYLKENIQKTHLHFSNSWLSLPSTRHPIDRH